MRPVRLETTQQTQQGPQQMATRFDDYREVDGLTLPFATTTTLPDGTEASSSTTEEIVLNPDFEDGLFTLGDS
jgi:hypothetical protein